MRRERLVKGWVAKCKELGIPVSETVTLCGTLANPIEVREWMLAGLPSDSTSVDNGILVTRGKRWPLMIDPQVRDPWGHPVKRLCGMFKV
jgi:dynein heavy chain